MTDPNRIEQRLLDLAYTTTARITAGSLAYWVPCTVDEASAVLERMAAKEQLRMSVEDDGTIVYDLPGREQFAAARAAAPAAAPPPPVLVRQAGRDLARRDDHRPSPLLAAALSALVPGAGHLYARHVAAALLWFFAVSTAYLLILPGLVLHAVNIASAATTAARESARAARRYEGEPGYFEFARRG